MHEFMPHVCGFFATMLIATVTMTVHAEGPDPIPEVVAHRGASWLAPENTVAAVRLAWQLDADAAEIDVYVTPDGRIVAIHDRSTLRTTGVDRDVTATPSDTLRTLDAGSWKSAGYAGERIPFLEEVMAVVPEGRRLVVEIKCGAEILPVLRELVGRTEMRGDLVFIGFGFGLMKDVKALMPDIPAYWLCTVGDDDGAGAVTLGSGDYRAPVAEALAAVAAAGLDGVNVGEKGIDGFLVEKVRAAGLDILAWTVNDPARARELAVMGARAITTDRSDVIRDGL